MNTDALLIVNAVLLLTALAGLILVLRRQGQAGQDTALRLELEALKAEAARQERALREELELSRRQAEVQAQGLRQEVVDTMTNLAGTQQRALEGLGLKLDGFGQDIRGQFEAFRGQADQQAAQARQEAAQGLKDTGEHMAKSLAANLDGFSQTQQQALDGFRQAQQQRLEAVGQEMAALGQTQRERLDGVRAELDKIGLLVEARLKEMQASNEARLEQMRATVDEKLQSTLEARLGESFRQVSEHLEKVHRSVGEMQDLAKGVGDLKRVLGEVKSRGIWGEVQLGALLEQVLAPEQYQRDLEIPPGSGQKVEFAIRLPGADDGEVWLPIDAKFPLLDYERLVAASEQADKAGVEEAARKIERFIKDKAKEISKYVAPPLTTNFAVMFLPVEGLYAEVLRRQDLATELQVKHRVMVAGPTTLYALLNSLQMGFRTLAIQKRSSEVWQILGAIKTEFAKYGEVIEKVRHKLQEADKHLDKVSVRRRAIDRRLKDVESLPEPQAVGLLGLEDLATEAEPTGEEE